LNKQGTSKEVLVMYSKEFRREVLAACAAGGGTCEVAMRFDVSESWVRRIKQERREPGKTAPKTTRDRRPTWQKWCDWLRENIAEKHRRLARHLSA
jgi:transposase